MGLYDDDAGFQQYLKDNGIKLDPEAPKEQLSAPAEIGKQLVGGLVVDVPKMVGGAGEWFSPRGSSAEQFFKNGKENWGASPEAWTPDTTNRGVLASTLIKGARAAAPSVMAMGATMANPALGVAGTLAAFGGSQGQETFDKGIAKGLDYDTARSAGWKTGVIEGVGEAVADLVGAKALSGAAKGVSALVGTGREEGLGGALRMARDPKWAGKFAKDWAANAAVQSGTEYGQGYGETAVENAYGISTESPNKQGVEGAQTALGLSMLLGPFGLAGHYRAGQRRNQINEILDNPNAPLEDKQRLGQMLHDHVVVPEVGKENGALWLDAFNEAVVQDVSKRDERSEYNPDIADTNTPLSLLDSRASDNYGYGAAPTVGKAKPARGLYLNTQQSTLQPSVDLLAGDSISEQEPQDSEVDHQVVLPTGDFNIGPAARVGGTVRPDRPVASPAPVPAAKIPTVPVVEESVKGEFSTPKANKVWESALTQLGDGHVALDGISEALAAGKVKTAETQLKKALVTTAAAPVTQAVSNPVPAATQEVAPVKLQAKDLTAKQRPLYDYMQTAIDTDNIGELVDAQGVFKYAEIGDKLGIARGSAKSFVNQIAKQIAKKNGVSVETMKEMLKARVAAIRTTESHDDDRLGLSPDQQAQVANEADYLGGEGGAEQSMGLISSVGGSQGETDGWRSGQEKLEHQAMMQRNRGVEVPPTSELYAVLRHADKTKNDTQPDAVQTAAENEFAQRRAVQARAEADAAFDAVLSNPEAAIAESDFSQTFDTKWETLTKPEQAEFVLSYIHAISEYDTYSEAEAALKKEFSHYGNIAEDNGSPRLQDTGGTSSQPRLEGLQGEGGQASEGKAPVVTTKKRRVVQREEVTKFSKGEGEQGTTTGAIQSAIADIAPKGSLKVRVVQSVDDLTPAERAAAEADAGQSLSMDQWGQVQAFVVNGKAYFIADNIPAGAERAVFLHEVGSHLGLEKLLSKQQFSQLVGKLKSWAAKNDNSQESQLAKAALDRVESAGTVAEDKDAELAAYFIEEAVKAGIDPTATKYSSELQRWFRTLWAAFKAAVRRLGMNSDKFTPQDVVDMAYGAARLELNGTWHGTAADFRNFDHKYMGSGEGAQAFGWGTYLAQKVGIAKGYWKDDVRRKGSGRAFVDGQGKPVAVSWNGPTGSAFNALWQANGDYAAARASQTGFGSKPVLAKLDEFERQGIVIKQENVDGALMRVDHSVHDDEMLDWDKPLSEQNKARIALMPLRKFLAHTADELTGGANWNDMTGSEMYHLVERALQQDYFNPNLPSVDEAIQHGKFDQAASEYLDSIGIKGIKFLDATSRSNNNYKVIPDNGRFYALKVLSNGNTSDIIGSMTGYTTEDEATAVAEAWKGSQTRNHVIFNDKNIQRVATQVGADRQRVKFSIQSPAMRKTSGLVKQLMEVASDKSKSVQYALMFGHQFSELAEKIIPGAKQYFASLNEKQRERVKQEEAIASIATNHYALKQSEQNAVNRMIDRATSQEAWPFKPEWIPEAKVDAQLGSEFNAMSPESQQVVKDVFKFGSEQQKRFDESINDLMPEGQKISRKQMMGVPYAPLKRFGDHVVVGKSAAFMKEESDLAAQGLPTSDKLDTMKSDPAHYHVEFVDGDFEAVTRRDALAEANPTMAWDKKPLQVEHRDLNAMSFTMLERLKNSISDVDKTQGATKSALEALANQLYVAQLNHLHANKSQQTRKGVKGYDQDMMRAFVSQGRSEASLIASLKTHSATEASLQKVKTAARQGGQQDNKTRIANEILRRHVAMLNYKETPIQNKLLATNSLYFLLTSPAYYLTNATQPFVLSLPVMTATHGSKAWGALTSAYKQAFDAIKLFKNTNLDETALKTFDSVGNESGAIKALLDENLVNIGMEMELGDIVDSGGGKVTKAFKGGMKFMRTTVANVETLNRLSTAVAAYRLAYTEALNQGNAKDEAHTAGTLYARDVIIKTHGDYAGYNAPSIMMQGAYGTLPVKVLMQFKKFQFIQAGLLIGAFKQSINGATPEEKAVARKTLAYVLGTQMALAGSLGIPLMGTAAAALAAMGADDGEDKEAYLRRLIGNKTIAQLLLHGAPAAAGVDMSKRIGMGNVFSPLPFVDDTGSNKDKAKNLIVGVAGPSASLFLRSAQGVDQMQKGQYWKGMESLLPNGAVTNLSKVARFESQGVTNNRGDVVMKPEEVGFFDDVTQALGLPSTTLTDRSWKASVDYDRKKHLQGEADALKRNYIEARKSGDSTAEIMQKWNKLQVERMKQGFTRQSMSNLVGAPNEQMKRERHTIGGIPYGKSDKKFVQNLDAL